jgi:hypothetical protein
MKRDLDLVRKLLLYYEEKEDYRMDSSPSVEGYDELQVLYHLLLMDEAGLIRCEREVSKSTPSVSLRSILSRSRGKGMSF